MIIAGSPGSGKSTYAREIRRENDIIIDFDELRKAISGKSHEDIKDFELINNMRKTAYRYIKEGKTKSRFIVLSTEAEEKKLNYLAEYLNADIYVMPTTQEQAKEFVKKDKTRKNKELFYRLIDEWYEKRKEAKEGQE